MQFESIGERIAEGRRALGISQEELGGRVGVSRQTVSRWEAGEAKPSVEAVMALCEALSVSSDYFIFGTDSTPAQAEVAAVAQTEALPAQSGDTMSEEDPAAPSDAEASGVQEQVPSGAQEQVPSGAQEQVSLEEAQEPLQAQEIGRKRAKNGVELFKYIILLSCLTFVGLVLGVAIVATLCIITSNLGAETVFSYTFTNVPTLILVLSLIGFAFVAALIVYIVLKIVINRKK